MARRPSLDQLAAGILAGDRGRLAQAITLIESTRSDARLEAEALLRRLWSRTGGAHRVGISGVPGAGKSTLIETLGLRLVEQGRRVAVLTIDPSSRLSGGSILGDKSRMHRLAQHPGAFIRPSPNATALGGVARRTRETLLLCEAAGHDVVIVETVGVGQSETLVADMVDCFLVLLVAGAGDELQGIKRGILELADLVVVNKADGDNLVRARQAVQDHLSALRLLRRRHASWQATAMAVSAREGTGLDDLWARVEEHRATLSSDGALDRLRQSQRATWLDSEIEWGLRQAFQADPEVAARLEAVRTAVRGGELLPSQAARELLQIFRPAP